MSSFKASAIHPRTASALTRTLYAAGFSLAISALSTQAYAGCQYLVASQWNNGFTATIKITNTSTSAINGWNVNWQYAGDNRITSSWNATLGGTNPYTATNLSWNRTIQPNQSIEFGVQGTKGAASAEIPVINGAACDSAATSSAAVSSAAVSSKPASSTPASSVPASSVPASSSKASSSSVANTAGTWGLDSTASYLNFATTKNTHNVEVHNFTGLSGNISSAGVATLTIDLNTVNTAVALRDQRMRDLLFETATYPTATVTLAVPATLLSSLSVGQSAATDISASLNLHGVTGAITTKVSVQKLSANRVLVQSLSPILVKAGDYALTDGVEALRAAVGIASISVAVPVDFALVFDAR
ncbi:cellulose binding domain-containing protein [Cellvibrio fibrivorans]|uniref:Polyisoprenoid-binding protein YceI n=1 Tax=Cellvibrio fibrivorans TaxID=126350 RepID=A0ABU1V429_9GAMM|nr:cellulose binding domain-containing protein [Cellvibrio fibrivorans]MDR7092201.1 polyisoprenoid-binding protein YceI [Cellvibrio fibrivorans]